MGANTLTSGMRGPNNIVFADGHHIRYGVPSFQLGGTVYGERTVDVIGSITFEDFTNNRKAVIIINTQKKKSYFSSKTTGSKDCFTGIIYDCKKTLTGDKESVKKNYCKDMKTIDSVDSLKKDVKKQIFEIEGSWLNNCIIDGKTYWDIAYDEPIRQIPDLDKNGPLILSSDWRYREDLIWLKYNS